MAKNMIMTENYCDECDDVLHAVFDIDDFESHRLGSIMCKCGTVVMPCNECEDHGMCGDCPWKDSIPTPAMSDVEYVKWIKENEPSSWEVLKDALNGGKYAEVIRELEESSEKGDEPNEESEDNLMWVALFKETDEDGNFGILNGLVYDSVGEAVNAIKNDIEEYKIGLMGDDIKVIEGDDSFEMYVDGRMMCTWGIQSVKSSTIANELD